MVQDETNLNAKSEQQNRFSSTTRDEVLRLYRRHGKGRKVDCSRDDDMARHGVVMEKKKNQANGGRRICSLRSTLCFITGLPGVACF